MRSLGRVAALPAAGLAAAAAVTLLTMMIATGAPGSRPLGAGAPLGDTLGDLGRGGSAEFAPLSPEILRDALGPGIVERLLGSPAEPISPVSDLRGTAPGAPPEPPPAEQPPLPEQLTEEPDVRIAMSVDRAEARPGDTLTYTVTVTNVGKGIARGLHITSHTPEQTTTVCGDPVVVQPPEEPGGEPGVSTCVPGLPGSGAHDVRYEAEELRPGEEERFEFKAAVRPDAPAGTVIRNHAHVSGTNVPLRTSNEVSTEVQSP